MKATRLEIKISGGRIIDANVLSNRACELVIETCVPEAKHDDAFVLVEASKLSLNDEFMRHIPKTQKQRETKSRIEKAIRCKVKDFYRPRYDPSYNEKTGKIEFVPGREPAVGHSVNWWIEKAKEFAPERGSRLGNDLEYAAFLGVFIKRLMKSGWSANDAWYAVCNDSKELGHYWNSKNAEHDFEPTGSREILNWICDIANTFKIVLDSESDRWVLLAGGCYGIDSDYFPLADLNHDIVFNLSGTSSVGWLVLEK